MNTKATLKLIVIIAYITILASEETIRYANFRAKENDWLFPFGSTVGIYCEQVTNSSIEVNYKSLDYTINRIVKDSQLQDDFATTYQFEVINLTTGLFTIKKLTNEINGTLFECRNEKELSARIVGFTRIDDNVNPTCTSSYQSRFIFEDSVQSDIEMSCTSEEGDPPVMMSTYIRDGNEIVTYNSTRTVSSYLHPSKTLSFSSDFNSSFNNSVFVCNVSQQLPAPYQSYQGSCSFGPILFLPLFSVTANPSTIDFSDIRKAVLRCTSNVSEVNLTWSNIPNHWKYDIKEGDTYIEVNVTDTGSDVNSEDIQCIGYYGDRNITSMIQISATNNPGTDVPYGDRDITSKMDYNEINDSGPDITVALVITAISLCLIFVMIVIVVLYFRLNVSFCNRNPELAKQNSSTNNANVRNTTITDDVVSSMRSQTENSALDVPAMIDNAIYETYKEKDCQNQTLSETERLEKEQEIEMVENEIYESSSFSGYE
ncbi:uncharacterized protein [Apostichopus japonicus]|uniref:uncharacterized protein isoform X1 n=1 Tax=Stichopus japonicus TaxID=307972 RepID=UPI003AB4D99B